MRTRDKGIIVGVLLLAGLVFTIHGCVLRQRFEEVDARIESMLPKDRGLAPMPHLEPGTLQLTLRLSRRRAEDPARAQTVVRLDGVDREFVLPLGGRGETPESQRIYDSVWFALEHVLKQTIAEQDPPPRHLKGEIVRAAGRAGAAVPEEDVVKAMDVLLKADVVDFYLASDVSEPD